MASFSNQAQLTYNNLVTNSNVVVGEIIEVLSATKTAVPADYSRNSDITYVISIVNTGTTAFNGLTVTDNLGAYTVDTQTYYPLTYTDGSVRYFVNGVLQSPPTVTATQTALVFTGINVPADGNAMIIYNARVNTFAPLDVTSTITNSATVTGGGLGTPVVVTETVSAEASPNLTITKSISPVPVTENGTLTYTFTIQNYGNSEAVATDNVVMTDTFDPILNDIIVTYNGTVWTENTEYTYDETTGEFATVAGNITVPAAVFTQNPDGTYAVTPGTVTLVVTGTL